MSEQRVLPLGKKIRYMFEALLVYIVFYIAKILPYKTASNIGEKIGVIIGPLFSSNKTAFKNLEIIFPEKTLEEKKDIVKGMWKNLGRIAGEYPHLKEIWSDAEFVGSENMAEAKNSNEAAIFFSAHLGNWELASHSAHSNGVFINLVYRKPNNYFVEDILAGARGRGSESTIAKGSQGAKQMLSVLKNKQALGILMDQKLNEGISVPFFNKDAMTAEAIAIFALKFNCPLYPVQVIRKDGTNFKVIIHPKLKVKPTGDKQKDIYNILLDINKYIEEWIKENPEQWLWIHKRWDKSVYKN